MSGAGVTAPPGYSRFTVRGATVVARDEYVDSIQDAMHDVRTLHLWASTAPGARGFRGRTTAWGARLPHAETDVVVRHAQHGGLLAALTTDLFWFPGRAPWELEVSERLRAARVRTPRVIAYVLYPAGLGLCRCDVATQQLPDGGDFPLMWKTSEDEQRDAILAATAVLIRQLGAAGAHHEDLNVKNVYITRATGEPRAYALDVDRVRFYDADDPRVTNGNLARIARSLRKARRQFALEMPEQAIARLTSLVREGGAAEFVPASGAKA